MGAWFSFNQALALDVAVWVIWSVAVSWWATQLPVRAVDSDGWLTRLRPWERDGRLYRRLGTSRWKRWLPDLGSVYGGRRKHFEQRRGPAAWRLLAGETRRAERAHWIILAALPAQALINNGLVLLPMTIYALIANIPCIVTQRYNRGRLLALCDRRNAYRGADSPWPGNPSDLTGSVASRR